MPLVAALLGGAVTAAAMQAAGGTGAESAEQGLLGVSSGGDSLSVRDIYDRAAPGVVYVRAQSVQPAAASAFDTGAGGNELSVSDGSGFVLDDEGRIVTNAHVVSGVTDVQVTFSSGQIVSAHVLGKDEETDLAVLAVDPDEVDLRPLELGDSDAVRPGDQAIAIGNPNGYEATAGTGHVAAEDQRIEAPGGYTIDGVFQTDAVITPASSGGPLIGADGRVIGITSRLAGDADAPTFAVPSNLARDVLAQLQESHKVIRPYLGLRPATRGSIVEVAGVYAGSPAEQAGIQVGDVIEAIDGSEVRTATELQDAIAARGPGEAVRLRLLRNGSRGEIDVRLTERPATLPGATAP